MKKHPEHHYQKFWFGFAVGSVVCGLFASAVGTKQGRSAMRKAVDFMEDIDSDPEQVHKMIDAIYEMYRSVSPEQPEDPSTQSTKSASSDTPDSSKEPNSKKESSGAGSITNVMEKMKEITASSRTDSQEKRFFSKNDTKKE